MPAASSTRCSNRSAAAFWRNNPVSCCKTAASGSGPNLRTAVLALFAFDARDLGQTAFQSEAVAALQGVTGVAWVNVTTFDSVAESITPADLAQLGATLGKRDHVRSELARVDRKAAPGSANRIVPAELVFMTPDIPDTLILTQAGG